MTNGDKIRSMTDEELLEYLTHCCPPVKCEDAIMCYDCWSRWLKQEVLQNAD